jgi:hypothetical protein
MAASPPAVERPAFYALAPGRMRDLVTLLHPPYTAWHLSYVLFGAAAAPAVHAGRVGATLLAFFLAVGIGAHALDELSGRPLGTALSRRTLIALAAGSVLGAVLVGVVVMIDVSWTLAPFIAAGTFLVVAYNLELFGGRFHTGLWFALAWGGFPAITAYWINALQIRPAGLLVAAGCCLLSTAQRRLSTPARELRRRTTALTGEQRLADGSTVELTSAAILAPLEGALSALSMALVVLSVGLIAVRL